MHQGCTLISLSLSFFLACLKKQFLNRVFQTLAQQKFNTKIYGYDPVIALHFGAVRDEVWSRTGFFRNKDMEGEPWVGVGSLGGAIPAFLMFNSFPSDDPALSSVVDLWGFYWGVWKLSENLGEENGNCRDLKAGNRDSNWLCAEESVCWRGYCGGSVLGQHWGHPSLWGPEEILASVVDCRLEGTLNCFQQTLGYLGRKENIGGEKVKSVKAFKKWSSSA